ncbi:MAG: ParB/RepB/Spo0J family partition protein [Proteobacteria bacterium]|jgi:ParB/RepB/Spo0J family partition protein|nr:ParB/RepB/Spo0J family partition protein [Pseudomonadota bacterium]
MLVQSYLTKEVPMALVFADPEFNCRGKIAPIDVVDLAKDIEQNGLIQPVVVRPYKPGENGSYEFKLIAGFRRHMAHVVIKKEMILVIIRDDITDESKERYYNLSENLKRANLNLVQEAKAIEKLVQLGLSRNEIAAHIGMSSGWCQVRKMILDLPEDIQKEVAAGVLSQPQIREVHSYWNHGNGRDQALNAVRIIKEGKEKGLKDITVNPNKILPNTKRLRNKRDILAMMDHIYNTIGLGLHSRALAWAGGEITDFEFFDSIKEEADKLGKNYTKPTEQIKFEGNL